MRIAMVSEHADPTSALGGTDAGGQNVHVAALSAALAERGHRVTVYTRRERPGSPRRSRLVPGVTVERVTAGPLAPLPKDELLPHMPQFAGELASSWRERPPDVVHAHFWMSGLAALDAVGSLSAPVPVAQTFHALGTVKKRFQGAADTSPSCRIPLEQRIGLACDEVIATCTDEVAELGLMGISRQHVSVVPCGVNVKAFSPDGPAAPRGRRPRLLTLGRLVRRKGTDTIIDALPELPDAELVIAGGPPPGELDSHPEVRRLRATATARGVLDRVIFTGGLAHDKIPALLRSADVVVCAPWYEPFGIVPLEAMACGVPVLASAVGGLTDTVVDGETGLHVPARDPAALARAARLLLAEPALRATFGAAGSRRVRHWYSWERVAAQTEAVYARLTGSRRPGTRRPATGQDAPALTEPPAAGGIAGWSL